MNAKRRELGRTLADIKVLLNSLAEIIYGENLVRRERKRGYDYKESGTIENFLKMLVREFSVCQFFGSITKSVGWDIPDIGSPAHIEELQEEILIVGIPVTLTAKSFDFVVDALDLPR